MGSRAVDPSGERVAGIDIGGTFIKVGILDRAGKMVGRGELESQAEQGFYHFVQRIGDALAHTLEETGTVAASLAGIGIGYPGTVYPETGLISGSPNIPGSQGSNIVAPLAERFGRAVVPINDASAATLGETRYGRGREVAARNLAMFTLGTGVGGGLVIDGKVLYGAHHQGSELGHIIVNPDGPQCGCGNFGCLEAMCGTAGILRAAWRRLQGGRPSLLWDHIQPHKPKELTPKMVSLAAAAGDPVALEVWAEIGYWLGIGCVTVINFIDPEMILLGGQIAKAGDPLIDAVRQTVTARQRLNPWPVENIQLAALGEDAGVIGAAAVVLQQLPD